MEIKTFFFDTYAFHEIITGNPNYRNYSGNIAIITTKLNLMELYYGLLVKYSKEVADKYYDSFIEFCVDITDDIIKKAMIFRHMNKARNLSYVDCIGYVVAKTRNVYFLTGDEQFRDFSNVEFVK